MKYYIVDDEIGIVKALENIVESRNLGETAGYETDPEQAVKEILRLSPDIVLADLLMSKMDGIELVGRVKARKPDITFVMISKVLDKDMIGQAYQAGVEFFITKPINIIEVEQVLNHVAEKIRMGNLVSHIKDMFDASEAEHAAPEKQADSLYEINLFLGNLGMLGEKGTADILSVCQYLIEQEEPYSREVLVRLAEEKQELPKNLEQRMRRAMKKGLSNVAALAVEDYGNEIVQTYAGYVFDFRNIREEMDYIKGTRVGKGRVNMAKFIEGLLLYRKSLL